MLGVRNYFPFDKYSYEIGLAFSNPLTALSYPSFASGHHFLSFTLLLLLLLLLSSSIYFLLMLICRRLVF